MIVEMSEQRQRLLCSRRRERGVDGLQILTVEPHFKRSRVGAYMSLVTRLGNGQHAFLLQHSRQTDLRRSRVMATGDVHDDQPC